MSPINVRRGAEAGCINFSCSYYVAQWAKSVLLLTFNVITVFYGSGMSNYSLTYKCQKNELHKNEEFCPLCAFLVS